MRGPSRATFSFSFMSYRFYTSLFLSSSDNNTRRAVKININMEFNVCECENFLCLAPTFLWLNVLMRFPFNSMRRDELTITSEKSFEFFLTLTIFIVAKSAFLVFRHSLWRKRENEQNHFMRMMIFFPLGG